MEGLLDVLRGRRVSRSRLALASAFGLFMGTGLFTFGYGQGWSYLSNDPRACANCHIMREHYDGWQKASHHAVATCNDCHTPHAAVPKYLAKLENGFRHSKAFTLNDFHEPIRIKPHNRKVLNHNCATCHAELVRAISAPHGMRVEALDCARCHAGVGHAPPR